MKFKILTYLIVILIFINCISCDSAVMPVYTVTGKVIDLNNSAQADLKVTIADQSVVSSGDGSFSLNNITFPYDVTVLNERNRTAILYKGLSKSNISLKLNYEGTGYDFSTLIVRLPENIINQDTYGKLIFTDGNFINGYGSIFPDEQQSIITIYINRTVTGKLILLTYRKLNGEIVSYENYGEIPEVQINPGSDYNFQFDSLDIMLDPGEQKVTGNLNLPEGLHSTRTSFYLSFSSKKISNRFVEFTEISSDQPGYIIPTGLPAQYLAMTVNHSIGNSGAGMGSSYEEFITDPVGGNEFDVKTFPILITPEDKSVNINNNTQFSFSDRSGSGVYVIYLLDRSREVNYEIVTSERNFTLEGLESLGLGSINNNNFFWLIQKTGTGSMDDYVTNFSDNPGYILLYSEGRTFSTAPVLE